MGGVWLTICGLGLELQTVGVSGSLGRSRSSMHLSRQGGDQETNTNIGDKALKSSNFVNIFHGFKTNTKHRCMHTYINKQLKTPGKKNPINFSQ